MNNDTSQSHRVQMEQIVRPKRNKSLPARLAAGDCDLYDFHPSSDNLEPLSTTQSCASSFRQSNTNSTAPLAPLAHLQTLQRRAHIITFDRSSITRASCDPALGLSEHLLPQSQQITSDEAHHNMSDIDSAVSVRRTRKGKRMGRPTMKDKNTDTRAQAEARLSYLDSLLLSALTQEAKENAKHNLDSAWLYSPAQQRSPALLMPSLHQDGDVIGNIRYIVRPPEPRYWERAQYKQRWESTKAAQAFDVSYTEADDFSTSEEDEPDQTISSTSSMQQNTAALHHNDEPDMSPPLPEFLDRLELISLLDLNNTLARHILRVLLKDCIDKYGSPGWFPRAQSILRLTPKERDWMEDNRINCLDAQESEESITAESHTWHYATRRMHREERQTHLDQEPEKALLWLEEDCKDWSCTKDEVKRAVLYLLQRGYGLKLVEDLDFGQFLEVESDEDGNGNDDDADGDDEKEEGAEDEAMRDAADDDNGDGEKESGAKDDDMREAADAGFVDGEKGEEGEDDGMGGAHDGNDEQDDGSVVEQAILENKQAFWSIRYASETSKRISR